MSFTDSGSLPLATPPPGVTPNFVNPPSRAYELEVGMSVCLAVASIFMILRFGGKALLTRSWAWDDATCLIGYAFFVAHNPITWTMAGGGMGRLLGTHNWDNLLEAANKEFFQRIYASLLTYAAACLFIKLSLSLLYLRLFRSKKIMQWLVLSGLVACVVAYLIVIIVSCVLCVPTPSEADGDMAWFVKASECSYSLARVRVFMGAFSAFSDIYLLVLPFGAIRGIRLPLRRKLGVGVVFSTGVIAVACSLGTIVYRGILFNSTDQMWDSVPLYVLSNAELCAGVICACALIFPFIFSSKSTHRRASKIPAGLQRPVGQWTLGDSRGSSVQTLVKGEGPPRSRTQALGFSEGELAFELAVDYRAEPRATSTNVEVCGFEGVTNAKLYGTESV